MGKMTNYYVFLRVFSQVKNRIHSPSNDFLSIPFMFLIDVESAYVVRPKPSWNYGVRLKLRSGLYQVRLNTSKRGVFSEKLSKRSNFWGEWGDRMWGEIDIRTISWYSCALGLIKIEYHRGWNNANSLPKIVLFSIKGEYSQRNCWNDRIFEVDGAIDRKWRESESMESYDRLLVRARVVT